MRRRVLPCNKDEESTVTSRPVIVVDHGSTDGTSENINNIFPDVIIITGDNTMWWTAATNLGVRYALDQGASSILTLNNDLVVGEDYLQSILNASFVYPNSIIGSVSVNIDNKEHVAFAGIRWNKLIAKYTPTIKNIKSFSDLQLDYNIIETDLLPGRGTLFPSAVFEEIGFFDDHKFPHYMADEDLSYRAKKKDYRLLVCVNAIVHSHLSATGINNTNSSLSKFSLLKQIFLSIKSPNNLFVRWNWAHNTTFPFLYFLIDSGRVLYSQIRKILKT
ncbi:glycosyltransferase family 2 protein [Spirosoma utsteinense]|uniref:GT2 family glycosyltransferase n=1 Tax=Spirosoma utsteinense TaxID=2585773 RepID=A0ABR6WFN3_9BACT|nr:glycosyltransferase family 2 protein [Spirosoma utsteinense]MBC3795361.1 GT2 family glycosyltransferase [Spirosoma utsteinense]